MPISTNVEFTQAEIDQPDLDALLRFLFAEPAPTAGGAA